MTATPGTQTNRAVAAHRKEGKTLSNTTPLAPTYAAWVLPFGTIRLDEDGLNVSLSRTVEEVELRRLQNLIASIDALADGGVMGLPHPPSDEITEDGLVRGGAVHALRKAGKAIQEIRDEYEECRA